MAYNDDAVLARLSALNESHDSIATAAQWIMFHKRHADRTVALWMQRLKDSSATRRLSLIYLANEVAQQSRIRRKEDFIIAFSPVIAEAAALAYKGAPTEIHGKLRRVIDVWKDRNIFEAPIQNAIESRLDELDKAKGTPRPGFGNSPFTSNPAAAAPPPEFAPLISSLQKVQKLTVPLKSALESANQEYEKQTDPSTAVPSAPVFAARLNGLLKTLSNAEIATKESVTARQSLIAGLETMLQEQKIELEKERSALSQLSARKTEIEEKKQQVELAIMRALGPADGNGPRTNGEEGALTQEPGRPEMEALTPPAMENFTPPPPEPEPLSPIGEKEIQNEADEVSIGATSHSVTISSNGSNKRRRVDDDSEILNIGTDDGIDEDVAEMLKGEEESH
ncbi:hypothetical protein LLEC1_03769 [Akanthomyces lecanii]|uniref:CID domain-containing protein n=1 Tax=Cordyceps confragosa TaxID=2714763 RepID=A0A179ITW5_CORDF|nr:hypothetical protein LLEC1_03769 [Akanthomyces lecanii]